MKQQCAAEEKRRIEDFHGRLECWRLARDIRQYAADLGAITRVASSKIDTNDSLAEHLGWVLRYADQIDR